MVGDILRAEREKQGLTIDDITRETSIRSRGCEYVDKWSEALKIQDLREG